MNKISVIIPTLNQEKYIEQCLLSIQQQSYKDIEIIVVDDGSTDRTLQILNRLRLTDDRIILLEQQRMGAGAARNLGMTAATGRYIHFVDSDDWLEPEAYSRLVEVQESTLSDVIVFLYNRYDNKTAEKKRVQLFPLATGKKEKTTAKERKKLFFATSVVPWNKFYLKSFLDATGATFDEIMVGNDRTFYHKTIIQAKSICLFSEVLINYRVNNNLSLVGNNRADHIEDLVKSHQNTISVLEKECAESTALAIKCAFEDLIETYIKSNDEQKHKAIKHLSDLFSCENLSKQAIKYKNEAWYPRYEMIKALSEIRKTTKDKEIIPVVMATNDKYAPYLAVAVESISKTLLSGKYCKIYVFHSGLSVKYINLIEGLDFDNLEAHCIDVSGMVEAEATYSRAHYSVEMYYRILIPELLDMYDKAAYLDCDLIVRRSISDLYNIELGDSYLAGVRNFCNQSMFNWVKNSLKLDPEQYINTGVLLFNNKLFRSSDAKQRCFQLLKSRDFLACPDQDMLNFACKDKIKIIDSGWNLQWHHTFEKSDTIDHSITDLNNARQKNYITHYTSGAKAWSHPSYQHAENFWQYARNSTVYSEIVRINIKNKINQIFSRIEEMKSSNF